MKSAKPTYLTQVATRLRQSLDRGNELFRNHFGDNVVLVPTPGSAPIRGDALWSPKEICDTFVREGLAQSVNPCLERAHAVVKSRTAPAGKRPNAKQHYDSMVVKGNSDLLVERITLVDDFVTRGCTLLAAFSKLQDAFPNAAIEAFAVVRTISGRDVEQILHPTEGTITLDEDNLVTYRRP